MADTQATEQATEGFEYADPLASDKAVWALVGAVKNLGDQKALERDASTGRYSNESIAAMVDKHKDGAGVHVPHPGRAVRQTSSR